MKTLVTIAIAVMLTACSTAGGLVSGMGEDLQRAGNWIKSK